MAIIAHRFGYKFTKYKINLCGAMSTIQLKYANSGAPSSASKNPKYELYYGAQGANNEDRFNTALEYLLDCLHGLVMDVRAKMSSHPSAQDKASLQSMQPDKGLIGGQSIRYKSADS